MSFRLNIVLPFATKMVPARNVLMLANLRFPVVGEAGAFFRSQICAKENYVGGVRHASRALGMGNLLRLVGCDRDVVHHGWFEYPL